jgi:hypothetical protein
MLLTFRSVLPDAPPAAAAAARRLGERTSRAAARRREDEPFEEEDEEAKSIAWTGMSKRGAGGAGRGGVLDLCVDEDSPKDMCASGRAFRA